MQVSLKLKQDAAFEITSGSGHQLIVDGPESVGGKNVGARPMEFCLSSLGACMSVDILHILQKGRQSIDDLHIKVNATRVDEVPAIFERIEIVVSGSGSFDEKRLSRAVDLSLEKYCSVAKMLAPLVEIKAHVVPYVKSK